MDGVLKVNLSTISDFVTTKSIMIGGNIACTVWSVIIYEKGKLLRDFIPVRRRSDGKVGMLDRVEGKFYTSQNGAGFTGG